MELLLALVGAGLVGLVPVAAVLVAYAGIRRLQGRPSRFDRAAEVTASAVSQMIYPPSLRGGGVTVPPPPADDDEDQA